jgi:hypothetical protein
MFATEVVFIRLIVSLRRLRCESAAVVILYLDTKGVTS